MLRHSWLLLPLFLAVVGPASSPLLADTLEQYAQACDLRIGATVPDFDCDAGTEVPMTHPHGKPPTTCDRPNRLNKECDPGSRFQVLTRTGDAYVVAHCRKRDAPKGIFKDIAVIQYNRTTGATCFYQALGTLPGQVKAPSKGQMAWPWLSPVQTAGVGCVRCHDNGQLIRSPYLTQVTGSNALPGAGDVTFNRDQPYSFIGKDFSDWRVYKVEVAGNTCNGCHRMGISNLSNRTFGTALDFGIRATQQAPELGKNPHSTDSPIWMVPGQITFNQTSADAANAIRNCALRGNEIPLPNSPNCRITEFTGLLTAPEDGALLREANGAIWVIVGGAKFHVPDPATLNRLFGGVPIVDVPSGRLDAIPVVPVGGTLLREENGAIWVIVGGAKFHVPDPATLNRLFAGKAFFQLWDGAPSGIPSVPVDGTLLREENGAIWVTVGGAKFHVPDPATLDRLFGGKGYFQLWDGAPSGIPSVPVDGTLLREENGAIWVTVGGAKFHVPDPAILNRLFAGKEFFQLWDDAPIGIPLVPVDGTLLVEESTAQVFRVSGGHKVPVPANTVGHVFVLWRGALSQIP